MRHCMAFWQVLEGYTNDGTPHIAGLRKYPGIGVGGRFDSTFNVILAAHRIRIVTLA
jgi:hypothetical protein